MVGVLLREEEVVVRDLLLQVVRGNLMVEFRTGPVALAAGDFLTIPRGSEYRTLGDATAAAVVVSPETKAP